MFRFFLILLPFLLAAKPAERDSIVLYFAGDVTLSNHFENFVDDSIEYAFKKLNWFSDADITMVNLENPLTKRGEPVDKMFTFRARPEYAQILINGGVDIVTLANNHIYDFGETGIYDTINSLRDHEIYYIGAGRNLEEARHPVIFYKDGFKLAYFAYYGTHKHSDSHPATLDSAGTAMRQLHLIKEDLEKYRNMVDLIVVNFHWGNEKADFPGSDQIFFAHSVIDYGADLIVGHHPHVLQGIEKYKDKIIAYSLGNFIFGGNSRTYETSAVLKVTIYTKTKTVNAIPIPIEINYWQPEKVAAKKKEDILTKIKQLSSKFEKSFLD